MASNADLVRGLVGWWPCSESSGSRADSLGLNTLAQAGSVTSAYFNPVFNDTLQNGACAVFDASGSNQLAVADNTRLRFGNTDYSVCAWVNCTGNDLNGSIGVNTFVGKLAPEADGYEYELGISSAGFFFGTHPLGTLAGAIYAIVPGTRPSTSFRIDRWFFCVGVKKANGPALCKVNNGDWASSAPAYAPAGGFATSAARFSIGRRVSSAGVAQNPVAMNILNVGVWSRVLTDTDVGTLWNGGYGLDYDFSYPDA